MANGAPSSFFVPSYLLGQIPEQDREAVISDAQKAFFLNLFGPSGGPGAAYQAAQNTGIGYLNAQKAAREAAQARAAAQAQQFAAGIINPEPNITGQMALGPAGQGRVGPTQQRADMIGAVNPMAQLPVPERIRQAAQAVTAFSPEYASQLANVADKAGPRYQFQEGLLVNMNNPNQRFVPKLEPGEEFVFDANGNITGVRNVSGKLQAVSERARVGESAKAEFAVERVTDAQGREYLVPRSAITGTAEGRRPTVGGGAAGGGAGATGGAPTGGRPGGLLAGLSPAERATQESDVKYQYETVLVPAKVAADAATKTNQTLGVLARLVESTPVNKFTSNEFVQAVGGYFKAAELLAPGAEKVISNMAALNGLISSAIMEKQTAQKGPQTEADARRLEMTLRGMGDKDATLFLINMDRALNEVAKERYRFILDQRAKGNLAGAEAAWVNRSEANLSIFRRPELRKYAERFTEIRELDGKRYRVFGDGGPPEEVK